MCEAGKAGHLVARADAIQHLHADDREVAILEEDHGKAVVEPLDRSIAKIQRGISR